MPERRYIHYTDNLGSSSSSQECLPVRNATLVALFAGLGLGGLLWSQAPPAMPDKPSKPANKPFVGPPDKETMEKQTRLDPKVVKLVEQLGDEDYRVRDAAYKALEALGAKAIPALRRAKDHSDAEISRRVGILLPRLEHAVMVAPKRVTLNLKKKPLKQILDELTKQTGYKIQSWGGDDKLQYDLVCDNVPFWDAFERLSQAAGLVLQPSYGDEYLRLNQQASFVPHVTRDGAFRLVANSFNQNKTIDLSTLPKNGGGARRSETLTFTFSIFSEPRLPLMSVGEPKITVALDNKDRSMIPVQGENGQPDAPFGRRFGGYYGYKSHHQQTSLNLRRPEESSKSVKVLRGTVPLTLLADQKAKVVTADILKAKGKKITVGKTTFDIQGVNLTEDKQFHLKMDVSEDSKDNGNDFTWMNSIYNRLHLQDDKGNQFQVYSTSWGSSSPNHVQLTLAYGPPPVAKAGPPAKLIYDVWTLVPHTVKFEFKDLPLP
jgi:hypothetical protein